MPKLSNISGLMNRNILIDGRRTSIKLDATMWAMLYEIAACEDLNVAGLFVQIWNLYERERMDRGIPEGLWDVTFTSAVRVFIASYYRQAAELGQRTLPQR